MTQRSCLMVQMVRMVTLRLMVKWWNGANGEMVEW